MKLLILFLLIGSSLYSYSSNFTFSKQAFGDKKIKMIDQQNALNILYSDKGIEYVANLPLDGSRLEFPQTTLDKIKADSPLSANFLKSLTFENGRRVSNSTVAFDLVYEVQYVSIFGSFDLNFRRQLIMTINSKFLEISLKKESLDSLNLHYLGRNKVDSQALFGKLFAFLVDIVLTTRTRSYFSSIYFM